MKKQAIVCALGLGLFAAAACTDPESGDTRGYTKAPLEDPGYTIEAEEPAPPTELGEAPNRPRPRELDVDTDSAGAAGS